MWCLKKWLSTGWPLEYRGVCPLIFVNLVSSCIHKKICSCVEWNTKCLIISWTPTPLENECLLEHHDGPSQIHCGSHPSTGSELERILKIIFRRWLSLDHMCGWWRLRNPFLQNFPRASLASRVGPQHIEPNNATPLSQDQYWIRYWQFKAQSRLENCWGKNGFCLRMG